MISIEARQTSPEKRTFQKWVDNWKSKKEKDLENKWFKKWSGLVEKKLNHAREKEKHPRYVNIHNSEWWNGTYITILHFLSGDLINIVFLDKNRDMGKGERQAVIIMNGQLHVLETKKSDEKDRSRNPHDWVMVFDANNRRKIINTSYEKLKRAKLFDHNGKDDWMGHFPGKDEVLSVIKERTPEDFK